MMRVSRMTTCVVAMGLGLLVFTQPRAGAADGSVADVTASNNAALASQYEAEAQSLRAKGEMHKKMLAAYKNNPAYKRQNPAGGEAAMSTHCQKLIDAYTTAAEQAEALAKEHKAAAGGS